MANLRDELLKKLSRAPYRYSSRQLFDAMPPNVFENVTDGMRWKQVEEELELMKDEGLLHAQNRNFVRIDRMTRMPPERQRSPKKSDPRQKGFGFE